MTLPDVDPALLVAGIAGAALLGLALVVLLRLQGQVKNELRAVRGADFDRGVRQDAQHVLLGATMPAVLVEVGFLNHPLEGRELVDPTVEDRIAEALARAVTAHLDAERLR